MLVIGIIYCHCNFHLALSYNYHAWYIAAIMCTSLAAPTMGYISFDPDTTSPYNYQTTATYGCAVGYGLFGGDTIRQCESGSDSTGRWTGTPQICEGTYLIYMYAVAV